MLQIQLLKQDLGICSLPWPGNSPDLNPIENLWAIMGRKINAKKPGSIEELKKLVEQVWYEEVSNDFLHELYSSMANRIAEVIQKKGGHTHY